MLNRRQLPKRLRGAQNPCTTFDPKDFLASSGIGKTLRRYSPKQVIFSQGERADTVLYIQHGRVRLTVLSKQGKEATIALLPAISWVRDASPRISPCAWRPRPRSAIVL